MQPYAKLEGALVALTGAATWEEARDGFRISSVDRVETGGRCICGQRIKERVHMIHKLTRQTIIVGNRCVEDMVGTSIDVLRKGLTDDWDAPLDTTVITALRRQDLITEAEARTLQVRRVAGSRRSEASVIQERVYHILHHRLIEKETDGAE